MSRHLNHVPWNNIEHIDTRKQEEDFEDYLSNLSRTVSRACEEFFKKRGMVVSYQFPETKKFNESEKKENQIN